MDSSDELQHQHRMIEYVFQLARKLEADHGEYLGQRDDLIRWLMEELDGFSAAGLDVSQARKRLRQRYQILIKRE